MENESKLPESWQALFDIKKTIQNMGGTTSFRDLLFDRITDEELNELYNSFTEYFESFPINHPLRLEATKLMLDIGFQIIDDGRDKTYLDQKIVDEVYSKIDIDNPVKIENN